LADLALADVPDHRLAGLVRRILAHLIAPAWVERALSRPKSRNDFPIGTGGP
jgi:hypothetical protein